MHMYSTGTVYQRTEFPCAKPSPQVHKSTLRPVCLVLFSFVFFFFLAFFFVRTAGHTCKLQLALSCSLVLILLYGAVLCSLVKCDSTLFCIIVSMIALWAALPKCIKLNLFGSCKPVVSSRNRLAIDIRTNIYTVHVCDDITMYFRHAALITQGSFVIALFVVLYRSIWYMYMHCMFSTDAQVVRQINQTINRWPTVC